MFKPEAAGYRFRGPVATGELIAGAIEGAHKVASPAGSNQLDMVNGYFRRAA